MSNTASRNSTENIENIAKQGLKDAQDAANNVANNAKQGFKDTLDVASNAACSITKEVQKGASEIGSALKGYSADAVKQFGDVGTEALEQATKALDDATKRLQSEIKKSPYVALGVAFGLGMALTCLFRRD